MLRIIGIVCGLGMLGVVFYRLRSHAEKRTDVWLFFIFGLALVLIGLFPNLVNFPAELLSLREVFGGRVITLLLISNALLWFFYFYERSKVSQRYFQFDEMVRRLTIQDFNKRYSENIDPASILIIIPAYNEAENLSELLTEIPDRIVDIVVNVLIIDDGSHDNTPDIADRHGAFVARHSTNRGGGAALKTGFEILPVFRPAVVVTMDADGQHRAEDIAALVEPIIRQEADLVIGSRRLGSFERYSIIRSIGVVLFSGFVSLLTGQRITDCSSGFRALRVMALKNLKLQQDQYHTAELIVEASKRNLKIQERAIRVMQRQHGKSKKGSDILYALRFLRTILTTWWR